MWKIALMNTYLKPCSNSQTGFLGPCPFFTPIMMLHPVVWATYSLVQYKTIIIRWMNKYKLPIHGVQDDYISCSCLDLTDVFRCCCQMYTPLHASVTSGQVSVVKLLLELGVEVDAVNCYGNTALHVACLNSQDTVVNELLMFGASINAVNNKGLVTPFVQYFVRGEKKKTDVVMGGQRGTKW